MIRHSKRQTRNDHIRERLAGDIDAHTKTVGPKKNAARRGLELIKKFPTRRAAALHQEIEFLLRKEFLHSPGHLLHPAITREKDERAPVGLLDKMRDPMFQRFLILSVARIGHFLHDEHLHLLLEIERAA